MPVELVQKVEGLSDLELALLLSFVANEHCLIQTEQNALDHLQQELQLIASNIYNVSHLVIECSTETTLNDFNNALLAGAAPGEGSGSPEDNRDADPAESEKDQRKRTTLTTPNIIVLRNPNLADYETQIQALELIRSKHIGDITAPKCFCMVIVQCGDGPPLNKHLNDHIFLSHYHDLEDGFTNLESASEWIEDDRSSSSSVVRRSVIQTQENRVERTFSDADVQSLVDKSKKVIMTAGVRCYLQNIVTFLRQHRAVDGGITPRATKAFDTLAKYIYPRAHLRATAKSFFRCLASLHGLDYVTPSLVAIAARKIYPHRIKLTVPERDRSLQYGSDLAAVRAYLEGVTPESIIEDVLAAVEPPL
ncbi:MAG: hypothetical protein Q9181_004971 [Wetmoreana brouardii]